MRQSTDWLIPNSDFSPNVWSPFNGDLIPRIWTSGSRVSNPKCFIKYMQRIPQMYFSCFKHAHVQHGIRALFIHIPVHINTNIDDTGMWDKVHDRWADRLNNNFLCLNKALLIIHYNVPSLMTGNIEKTYNLYGITLKPPTSGCTPSRSNLTILQKE